MEYISTFIISIMIAFVLEGKIRKSKKKYISLIYSLIAFLPMLFLAALRDPSIGTDTSIYVVPWFERAGYSSFESFMSLISTEKLFYILVFVVRKITSSYFLLFFVIELLIILPLLISQLFVKDKMRFSIFTMVFSLLLFNDSLCYMRQFIATSFLILAYVLFFEGKRVLPLCIALLSMGFHNSAIYIILIFLIFYYVKNRRLKTFLILLIVASFVVFNEFVQYLYMLGILNEKYFNSLLRYKETLDDVSYADIIMWTIFFSTFVIGKKSFLYKKDIYINLKYINLIGLISTYGMFVSGYFYRISLYSRIFCSISLPMFTMPLYNNSKYRQVIKVVFLFSLIIFWVWFYLLKQYSGTYPYKFYGR